MNQIIVGDCRDTMRRLIAEGVRVQTCVTSPPYWGLRDYGVAGQLGLEPTIQEYVANMVEVFGLVRELLADDGTLWLNLGDSYAQNGGPGWQGKGGQRADRRFTATRDSVGMRGVMRRPPNALKPKDLCGIPWRVAFSLQEAGWWLRQDIIWSKPNPMPESVTDRCTKAHEYLFLMAKSERYYYDNEAISEPADPANGRDSQTFRRYVPPGRQPDSGFVNGRRYDTRNKRSVWTVTTQAYAEAHFATYPPALIEPCILAGSRAGDIVFDPFMGSGTTAQVALELGRRYLGCELNPEYAKLAEQRTKVTPGFDFSPLTPHPSPLTAAEAQP